MTSLPDRKALAEIWHSILGYTDRPEDLFGSLAGKFIDRGGAFEDRLPHPGFVGRDYTSGGLLFLGMNPGNGPGGVDPGQAPHYAALKTLLTATPSHRASAFDALMACDETWYPDIRIMRVVVQPILDGLELGFRDVAYLNVLKWRTQESSGLGPLFRRSLAAHTLEQIRGLDPTLIIVLGVGLGKVLERIPEYQSAFGSRSHTIPRSRGDHYLTVSGQAAAKEAISRFQTVKGLCPCPKPRKPLPMGERP